MSRDRFSSDSEDDTPIGQLFAKRPCLRPAAASGAERAGAGLVPARPWLGPSEDLLRWYEWPAGDGHQEPLESHLKPIRVGGAAHLQHPVPPFGAWFSIPGSGCLLTRWRNSSEVERGRLPDFVATQPQAVATAATLARSAVCRNIEARGPRARARGDAILSRDSRPCVRAPPGRQATIGYHSPFSRVVEALCAAICALLDDNRDLLAALLRAAARDAREGPFLFLAVPERVTEEWRSLSLALYDFYGGLGLVVRRKMYTAPARDSRGRFPPGGRRSVADVPAALVMWVIEVYGALVLRAQEAGLEQSKCILCEEAVADTAIGACRHMYYCRACLEAWARKQRALTCPVCRAPADFICTSRKPR